MNNNVLSNVGYNIRILRKKKKLTIDELAERAGLSGKYLQGVEVGTRNISIKNLNKIVIALNTSFQYLVMNNNLNNIEGREEKIMAISEKLKKFDMPKLNIIGNMLDDMDIAFQESHEKRDTVR